MPGAGLEPARGQPPVDFESTASPNSATRARFKKNLLLKRAKNILIEFEKLASAIIL